MDPAHGTRHGYGYKLGLTLVLREDQSKPRAISGLQEHAVETIFDVMLAGLYRPIAWMSVSDLVQQAVQGPPKLHGLRRSVRQGGDVDGVPSPWPGVIAKQAGLVVAFILDSSWGQLQVGKVTGD